MKILIKRAANANHHWRQLATRTQLPRWHRHLSNFFTWDLAKALEEVGEQSESDDELQTVARIRKWIDWIEMYNSVARVNATMTVATAEDMSEKDHESGENDESEEQDGWDVSAA